VTPRMRPAAVSKVRAFLVLTSELAPAPLCDLRLSRPTARSVSRTDPRDTA